VAQTQQEWNAEGYSNPDLDRALKEAIQTQKPDEAARRYQAVEKMYLQDLAACELFWSTEQYLVKPTVRGYGGNALLPFKWYNVAILRGT
jgi:ABC-type transport system substrate-binding protein